MWAVAIKQQKGLEMNLRYITCSDPRNYNSYRDLKELWNLDERVEIAVQMHPGKVSPDTERYRWVQELVKTHLYADFYRENFAMHINLDWCDDICNGQIPEPLQDFFNARRLFAPTPIVQRIQLNMPQKTADNFNPQKLKQIIDYYPNKEFILQYNPRTKNAVQELYKLTHKFSLLFDASGGRGVDAKTWEKPVFHDEISMGYSGGLSPENITNNLDKIQTVANPFDIWIDAEGKLKTDDKFDVSRAAQYIKNTLAWEQKQR